MIRSCDLSVVVQGAVVKKENLTQKVCESIRKFLPNSEIILSTWRESDVSAIDYDLLIENEDPGSMESFYHGHDSVPTVNNFNRQIVSSLNGIRSATRKYVMKLRSDSMLVGDVFLDLYNRYSDNESKVGCFEPRNAWGNFENQLSLCDFWFIGRKEDLLKLWDIELYKNGYVDERDIIGEEYLAAMVIYNKYGISVSDFISDSYKYRDSLYKFVLRDDFIILPTRKTGIVCEKYPRLNDFLTVCIKHYVVSFSDWKYMNIRSSWDGILFLIPHVIETILGSIIQKIKQKNGMVK